MVDHIALPLEQNMQGARLLGGRFVGGLRSCTRRQVKRPALSDQRKNVVRGVAYGAMGEPVAGALVGFVSR